MNDYFKDKHVIVTGGASGIGYELSRQLLTYGADVTMVGRTLETGQAALKTLQGPNKLIAFMQADMTDMAAVEHMVTQYKATHPRIDIFINNAGIFMAGETRDTTHADAIAVLTNNIFGVINGTFAVYNDMVARGNGQLVTIASAAGLMPVPAMGIYGASKFALVGFSRNLRNEAAALGVKVNTVCPTIIDTPLYDTARYEHVNTTKAFKLRKKAQTADVAASRILKGIAKNKPVIHTAFVTKFGATFSALFPRAYDTLARRIYTDYRENIRSDN